MTKPKDIAQENRIIETCPICKGDGYVILQNFENTEWCEIKCYCDNGKIQVEKASVESGQSNPLTNQ